MRASRTLVLIVTAAALVAAAVGCGSSGGTSTEAGPSSTTAPAQAAGSPDRGAKSSQPPKSSTAAGNAGKGAGSAAAPGGGSTEAEELAQAQREEGESGDQSIQEYGSEPDEAASEEVVDAMRSFVKAMGAGDFGTVCEDFSSQMKKQLEAFLGAQKEKLAGSCPALLSKLIPKVEQRKAQRILDGVVTRVRVKDDTAFVLVKPTGEKVSYFVLAREDGQWKATSTALGVPLIP